MASERGLDDSSAYLAPPPEGAPDAWTAAAGNGDTTQLLLGVEEIVPPESIAAALELSAAETVVVRSRLMLLDGKPVEIAKSYYPNLLAAGTPLAEDRKIKGGAPVALAALGLVVAYADETVDLDSRPLGEDALLLQVDEMTRVVRLFRTAYTETDTPIEVTASVMLPAGRKLQHRIAVS